MPEVTPMSGAQLNVAYHPANASSKKVIGAAIQLTYSPHEVATFESPIKVNRLPGSDYSAWGNLTQQASAHVARASSQLATGMATVQPPLVSNVALAGEAAVRLKRCDTAVSDDESIKTS